jgi:hypothetical protein
MKASTKINRLRLFSLADAQELTNLINANSQILHDCDKVELEIKQA